MFRILIILLLISCSSTNSHKQQFDSQEIQSLELSQTFPEISMSGEILGLDTPKIYLYYFDSLEMYQIPYNYSDDEVEYEKRFFYLVREKGKNRGLKYYFGDSAATATNVTEELSDNWFNSLDFPQTLRENGTLKARTESRQGKTLQMLYILRGFQNGMTMNGSMLLTYTAELKDLDFSFCWELDTIRNMKLTQITIDNDSKFVPQYNITLPSVEIYYRLEEKKNLDLSIVTRVFESFKRDRAGLLMNHESEI